MYVPCVQIPGQHDENREDGIGFVVPSGLKCTEGICWHRVVHEAHQETKFTATFVPNSARDESRLRSGFVSVHDLNHNKYSNSFHPLLLHPRV